MGLQGEEVQVRGWPAARAVEVGARKKRTEKSTPGKKGRGKEEITRLGMAVSNDWDTTGRNC